MEQCNGSLIPRESDSLRAWSQLDTQWAHCDLCRPQSVLQTTCLWFAIWSCFSSLFILSHDGVFRFCQRWSTASEPHIHTGAWWELLKRLPPTGFHNHCLPGRLACMYFFVSRAVFKAVTFLLPFKSSHLLGACVMNELLYESFIEWRAPLINVSSVFFYVSFTVRDLLQERKQESSRFVRDTSKINSPLPEPLPGLPQCLPLMVHLLLVIGSRGHHFCDLWWERNSSLAPPQEGVWLFNEVFAIAVW